jgi:hypothetical protein
LAGDDVSGGSDRRRDGESGAEEDGEDGGTHAGRYGLGVFGGLMEGLEEWFGFVDKLVERRMNVIGQLCGTKTEEQ